MPNETRFPVRLEALALSKKPTIVSFLNSELKERTREILRSSAPYCCFLFPLARQETQDWQSAASLTNLPIHYLHHQRRSFGSERELTRIPDYPIDRFSHFKCPSVQPGINSRLKWSEWIETSLSRTAIRLFVGTIDVMEKLLCFLEGKLVESLARHETFSTIVLWSDPIPSWFLGVTNHEDICRSLQTLDAKT